MNKIDIRQLESRLINSSFQTEKVQKDTSKNFREILEKSQNKNDEIKFSKHVLERMDSRDIKLDLDEVNKLEKGFKKAEEKGIRDALIIVGNKGFIVSIENKTIITTVINEQLKENVFTNIDGAVIL